MFAFPKSRKMHQKRSINVSKIWNTNLKLYEYRNWDVFFSRGGAFHRTRSIDVAIYDRLGRHAKSETHRTRTKARGSWVHVLATPFFCRLSALEARTTISPSYYLSRCVLWTSPFQLSRRDVSWSASYERVRVRAWADVLNRIHFGVWRNEEIFARSEEKRSEWVRLIEV